MAQADGHARPEGDGIHWTDTVHCGRIFCVRCGPPKPKEDDRGAAS